MKRRVLFVCLGNICRSPLAEGLARSKAETEGLTELFFDSAATGGWHNGHPPDGRAVVAGRGHGVDISDQRARVLRESDFEQFDMIVAVDRAVREAIEQRRPTGNSTPVALLGSFGQDDNPDIPDPYYTGRFEAVIARIQDSLPGLFAELQATDPQ